MDVRTERSNIYKMNNTSDSNVRELKIDSTLWATPAKIINLLDFKPEKLSIKTENNDNIDIKIHQVSDCNWIRTHNHLVHKRTLNHLAKLASQFG